MKINLDKLKRLLEEEKDPIFRELIKNMVDRVLFFDDRIEMAPLGVRLSIETLRDMNLIKEEDFPNPMLLKS